MREPKPAYSKTKVELEPLDGFIHYSLAIGFGLPILFFAAYVLFGRLGLFGIRSSIDLTAVIIPGAFLAPLSLLFYFIQRDKLRFQFIRTSTGIDGSKLLIREIAKEQKWIIQSFKDNVFMIKTNPGFVNQSWGQQITIKLVRGGVLVNSIFDTSKGSMLITFGSNQKNIDNIKRAIQSKIIAQKDKSLTLDELKA